VGFGLSFDEILERMEGGIEMMSYDEYCLSINAMPEPSHA